MCTKCDPNSSYYLVDKATSSCVSACPAGTYEDTNQCLPCVSPCLTCTSATQCSSCLPSPNPAFYFQSATNSCVEKCESNQLASPSSLCVDCEFPCKSCAAQPETCLACESGLYLYGKDCVASCPYHFYQDNTVM